MKQLSQRMVCIIPHFEVNGVQLMSEPLVFITDYCRIENTRLDANEGHIGWTERPLGQELHRLRNHSDSGHRARERQT